MPYSDVTQPLPRPRIQPGTVSSIIAVQTSRVLPIENSTDPCAFSMKPGSIVTGRSSAGPAAVGTGHAAAASAAGSTRSTSVSGS